MFGWLDKLWRTDNVEEAVEKVALEERLQVVYVDSDSSRRDAIQSCVDSTLDDLSSELAIKYDAVFIDDVKALSEYAGKGNLSLYIISGREREVTDAIDAIYFADRSLEWAGKRNRVKPYAVVLGQASKKARISRVVKSRRSRVSTIATYLLQRDGSLNGVYKDQLPGKVETSVRAVVEAYGKK